MNNILLVRSSFARLFSRIDEFLINKLQNLIYVLREKQGLSKFELAALLTSLAGGVAGIAAACSLYEANWARLLFCLGAIWYSALRMREFARLNFINLEIEINPAKLRAFDVSTVMNEGDRMRALVGVILVAVVAIVFTSIATAGIASLILIFCSFVATLMNLGAQYVLGCFALPGRYSLFD